jgi:hypothetical protein
MFIVLLLFGVHGVLLPLNVHHVIVVFGAHCVVDIASCSSYCCY